jgi:hypothetical protein
MAVCAYCKAEMELYGSGVPICSRCSEARETTLKPPTATNAVREILVQEVLETTAKKGEAFIKSKSILDQFPSGLAHPNGRQQIKSASHELSIARKEMALAYTRLNDYLNTGIAPENLKLKVKRKASSA